MKLPPHAAHSAKRGLRVVAQHIESQRQLDRGADRRARGGHGGNGLRPDTRLGEWRVAEVFDDDRVNAAALVGPGVGKGKIDDGLQAATPFG